MPVRGGLESRLTQLPRLSQRSRRHGACWGPDWVLEKNVQSAGRRRPHRQLRLRPKVDTGLNNSSKDSPLPATPSSCASGALPRRKAFLAASAQSRRPFRHPQACNVAGVVFLSRGALSFCSDHATSSGYMRARRPARAAPRPLLPTLQPHRALRFLLGVAPQPQPCCVVLPPLSVVTDPGIAWFRSCRLFSRSTGSIISSQASARTGPGGLGLS